MKLSAALIASHLQEHYSLQIADEMSMLPTLEHVFFYTDPDSYKENTIYIRNSAIESSEDLRLPSGSMLLLTGDAAASVTELPANVCRLVDPISSPARLMNTLTEIFNLFPCPTDEHADRDL